MILQHKHVNVLLELRKTLEDIVVKKLMSMMIKESVFVQVLKFLLQKKLLKMVQTDVYVQLVLQEINIMFVVKVIMKFMTNKETVLVNLDFSEILGTVNVQLVLKTVKNVKNLMNVHYVLMDFT